MTPEGKVKNTVKKTLAAFGLAAAGSKEELQKENPGCNGWYYMPVKGTSMGVNGIPDFIGCVRGLFFAIETKAGRGALTGNQENRIRGIQRGGGRVFVINEVDGELTALEDWLREVTC